MKSVASATNEDADAKLACLSHCKALLSPGAVGPAAFRFVEVKQEVLQIATSILSMVVYIQVQRDGPGSQSKLLADTQLADCVERLGATAKKLHPSSVPKSVQPILSIGRNWLR